MPYEGERATGESLIALERSDAFKRFQGRIATKGDGWKPERPLVRRIERSGWTPRTVIAIDGSTVTARVENGFPGADASLVMLAVVFIDLTRLDAIRPGEIPPPTVFSQMDTAHTLDAVLPGCNITRDGNPNDSPRRFFRASVHETLCGRLDRKHESLVETLRALPASSEVAKAVRCPIEGCDRRIQEGIGTYRCPCGSEDIFETDSFRFHERFNETGPNGEVHGEVRHAVEVLALVNLLRFFVEGDRIDLLQDCAFVLDGPLAVFGQPAKIAPRVRKEIIRLNDIVKRKTGRDLLILGIEKTGQYVEHLRNLDWSQEEGPGGGLQSGDVIIPDDSYVKRNITFQPPGSTATGDATYFGRKVLYKTRSGGHAVLNLAMLNREATDVNNVSDRAFPRLGDALNILDHLATYLHQDGFMPLVRAHAHAAIPLHRGTDILKQLFRP